MNANRYSVVRLTKSFGATLSGSLGAYVVRPTGYIASKDRSDFGNILDQFGLLCREDYRHVICPGYGLRVSVTARFGCNESRLGGVYPLIGVYSIGAEVLIAASRASSSDYVCVCERIPHGEKLQVNLFLARL